MTIKEISPSTRRGIATASSRQQEEKKKLCRRIAKSSGRNCRKTLLVSLSMVYASVQQFYHYRIFWRLNSRNEVKEKFSAVHGKSTCMRHVLHVSFLHGISIKTSLFWSLQIQLAQSSQNLYNKFLQESPCIIIIIHLWAQSFQNLPCTHARAQWDWSS